MSGGDAFIVPEARLAEALGLPRKAIKAVRADVLESGVDWSHAAGGQVCYSRGGIERTLAALNIAPEKIALVMPAAADVAPPAKCATGVDFIAVGGNRGGKTAAAKAEADASPGQSIEQATALDLTEPEVVEIVVTRCHHVNRRLVSGTLAGRLVRVRVRSNEKLRAGMVLRCKRVPEGTDIFELAERLPRWAGKR